MQHHIKDKSVTHPLRDKRPTHLTSANITIIVHDDYLYVEQEYVHTIVATPCEMTHKIAYLFHLIE
jgi:hypothetical protein